MADDQRRLSHSHLAPSKGANSPRADELRLRIALCRNPRLLSALMRELEQLKKAAQ